MPGLRISCGTAALLMATTALPAAAADTLAESNIKLIEPGESVPVSKIPDGIFLRTVNDPDDIIWARIPEFRVEMGLAPPVHPSVEIRYTDDYPTENLVFQLARTSDRFYVRLRWMDETENVATKRDAFRDGAAIEFSSGDDYVSYMMGSGAEETVNIWYWHPEGDRVESLAAGGPGSITRLEEQPVTGGSEYLTGANADDSEWIVVMSRPLVAEGEHQISFDRETIPVAFAVWQGADDQRDGLKLVSQDWIIAELTPDTGPAAGN